MADIHLFREWLQASHKKRSISWSQGLRECFDLGPERSDEDLAAEDAGGEIIAEVDRELWRILSNGRDGAKAQFLAAFEIDDDRDRVRVRRPSPPGPWHHRHGSRGEPAPNHPARPSTTNT